MCAHDHAQAHNNDNNNNNVQNFRTTVQNKLSQSRKTTKLDQQN